MFRLNFCTLIYNPFKFHIVILQNVEKILVVNIYSKQSMFDIEISLITQGVAHISFFVYFLKPLYVVDVSI